MIERYWSPEEVAERLSLSPSAIWRACREGRMRSFVLPGGRSRRIPESAIQEWLNEGDQGSTVGGSVIELRRSG